ncbi:hypothetical protein GRI55_06860 [Erythrobacter citreus]|uniref:Uncharacterized protein n=1 Tax=Qipengyuania citrea TaxID=225971 RepID=A0A6I4U9A1_9SPHN|nr:hypothetical protein [Qipengyuania citrea]MDQ0565497.1 hypothetical protein [Qipengyuania citrea]MXP35492.1 hypothetical protein [Qipengyuania citrea]
MAKLSFRDCIPWVFAPLIDASRRTDLVDTLRLVPPPKEVRNEQFARFGSLKRPDSTAIPLPNGGFFLRFQQANQTSFAFSSYIDDIDRDPDLDFWLAENEAVIENLDQALFLYLAKFAHPHFSIRPRFKSRAEARNIVEIAEANSYEGHNADDLIEVYRPTFVVTLPKDSLLEDVDDYTLCSELSSMISDLRSPIIDQTFAGKVHLLLGNHLVSSESIYLVLTSTRWRYAFMELFRILETTLHVPWLLDLTKDLSIGGSLVDLYRNLREKLSWKEAKGNSVERVFRDLNGDEDLLRFEKTVSVFAGIDLDAEEFCRSSIGRKIWKTRNQLVHPEDFTDGSKLEVSEDQFRALSNYLIEVIAKIFAKIPDGALRAS